MPLLCAIIVGCGSDPRPASTTAPPTTPVPPPQPEREEGPAPPSLPTPTGLRVSGAGHDFIEWSWNAVEGATDYAVQRSPDGVFQDSEDGPVVIYSTPETIHRADGLAPNSTLYIRVQAEKQTITSDGHKAFTSAWSGHVGGVTTSRPVREPEPEPQQDCRRSTNDQPDDFAGPQIHFIYAVASDGIDLGLDTTCGLADIVHDMQDYLGRQIGKELRIDTYNGEPDITFVRLADLEERDILDETTLDLYSIRLAVASAIGLERPKFYAVFYGFDWDITGISRKGIGGLAGNADGVGLAVVTTSTLYPAGGGFPDVDRDLGFTMVHEIFHLMGAVPVCAPHHDGTKHVYRPSVEIGDIMSAGGGIARGDEPFVDYGRDDYYGHGRSDCLDIAGSPYFRPVN